MRRELLQAQGCCWCCAGTCLLPWGASGLQTHRVPQRDPQECCGAVLGHAAAFPGINTSTNPQLLPCPGGCGPGLGRAGSVVGHAGLSRPSRGRAGLGRPGGTTATCPCTGTPPATKPHIVVTAAGRGVTGMPGPSNPAGCSGDGEARCRESPAPCTRRPAHSAPSRSPGFPSRGCPCAGGQAGAWQLHQLPAEKGIL